MHEEAASTPVYPARLPANWWLKNRRYLMYMVRELTAVFAALWVLLFVMQLPLMAGGPAGQVQWLANVRSPGWIVFSVVSLIFVLYHAWTFLTSTGTVFYLRFGEGPPIPGSSLNALMVLGWMVSTMVVAFVLVIPAIGG